MEPKNKSLKYSFEGFIKLITLYKYMLETKKTVALYSEYEHAKEDAIYELLQHNKGMDEGDLFTAIEKIEQICNVEEYFDSI